MPRSQPDPRFSYGDYRRWTGDERWELFDGRAVAMTPAPSRRHQEVVGELFRQIADQLRGHRCRVYVAPFDVRLPTGDEPDDAIETVVQPDITVVCSPDKLDDAGCRGAPDLVIEVLSPQTAARDRIEKRDLYAKHGVGEYWVVDPTEAWALVHRQRSEHGFGEPARVDAVDRTTCEALPDVAIDWSLVFPAP